MSKQLQESNLLQSINLFHSNSIDQKPVLFAQFIKTHQSSRVSEHAQKYLTTQDLFCITDKFTQTDAFYSELSQSINSSLKLITRKQYFQNLKKLTQIIENYNRRINAIERSLRSCLIVNEKLMEIIESQKNLIQIQSQEIIGMGRQWMAVCNAFHESNQNRIDLNCFSIENKMKSVISKIKADIFSKDETHVKKLFKLRIQQLQKNQREMQEKLTKRQNQVKELSSENKELSQISESFIKYFKEHVNRNKF